MMNLYVNLLLDTERRSSSRVSRRFICFLAAGLGGVLLLAAVLVSGIGAYAARQQLHFAEQEKKQVEPIYKSITALRQELNELQDLTNSVTAGAGSRPDWPFLLVGIQSVVPPDIQFTRMTVNEAITVTENAPGRVMTLYICGKALGENSDKDVQRLEKDMKEKKPFCDIMQTAEVKQFEADKNRAQQNTRLFDLECRFKPVQLFQPVKPKPQEKKK